MLCARKKQKSDSFILQSWETSVKNKRWVVCGTNALKGDDYANCQTVAPLRMITRQ